MSMKENYQQIARGIERLFSPRVEIVLHDLGKNEISFIAGPASSRKASDPSHLSLSDRSLPAGVVGPYLKTGEGGEKQRSISIVLEGEDGHPGYMLCINFIVGELEKAIQILANYVVTSDDKPLNEHFTENWQDKINKFIENYLIRKSSSIRQLLREEKKELVLELKKNGAFQGKHAATYIAESLKISRASVYSYIKKDHIND
ncbi:MAG: transcriptional regulator [Oligoflexales bacterium]